MQRILLISLLVLGLGFYLLHPTHPTQSAELAVTFPTSDRIGVQLNYGNFSDTMAQKLDTAGTGTVRFDATWTRITPDSTTYVAPSAYTWGSLDQIVNQARSHGMALIAVVGGNPPWAAEDGRGPVNCPGYGIGHFEEYLRTIVTRYQDKVRYWEIYNEPDAVSYTQTNPTCNGDYHAEMFGSNPQEYVNYLRRANEIVKGIDQDAVVLSGGVAFDLFTTQPGGGVFARDFVPQILSLGAANYFDAFNFHYYTLFDANWIAETGAPTGLHGKTQVIKSLLSQYGAANKPLVLTEMGFSSDPQFGNGSVQGQVNELIKQYTRGLDLGFQMMIWYQAADYSYFDYFQRHGLMDTQLNTKPAYDAFQYFALNPGASPVEQQLPSNFLGGSGVEAYKFVNSQGKELVVAWTTDGSQQIVPRPRGYFVLDEFGKPLGDDTLLLSGEPTYLNNLALTPQLYIPIIIH